MPLGKEVGFGPGHIVLDGDQVGTQLPQQPLPTYGEGFIYIWPTSICISSSIHLMVTFHMLIFPKLIMFLFKSVKCTCWNNKLQWG